MITKPDMGQAINEALRYIDRVTAPGDAVAVFPEGGVDFLGGRNPLREGSSAGLPDAWEKARDSAASDAGSPSSSPNRPDGVGGRVRPG